MGDSTNTAPVLSSQIDNMMVDGDIVYTYDTSSHFSDSDVNDTLIYSAFIEIDNSYFYIRGSETEWFGVSYLPSWLSINSYTGVISGTLANDDAILDIVVIAQDSAGLRTFGTFTLTINDTNPAPILITNIPTAEVNGDTVFTYDLSSHFSDINVGDVLSYSLTNGNSSQIITTSDGWSSGGGDPSEESWIQLDSQTGILTAASADANIGNYKIGINVSDGNDSITSYLYLKVGRVNDAPVLTGEFSGSISIGQNNTTYGEIVGSDSYNVNFEDLFYVNFFNTVGWSTHTETTNSDGQYVTTFENLWGDSVAVTTDDSWVDMDEWSWYSYNHLPNYYLETNNQEWISSTEINDNGTIVATRADSLGNYQTNTIYTDNSIEAIYNSANSLFYNGIQAQMHMNAFGDATISLSAVFKETGSIFTVDIIGNLDNSSGDIPILSSTFAIDGVVIIVDDFTYFSDFDSLYIPISSTEYGIDSVLSLEVNSLLYQIQDQQGIYGSLKLDEQINWTYTLDENDPDTLALTSGQVATDSFVITLSDGISITMQQIDVTVARGAIYTTDNKLLDSISLNYFKDGLDTGISTLVEGGDITFPDTSLDFDAVKLSDPAAYNDTSSIQADDAVAILRDIVFLDIIETESTIWHAADVNNDGRIAADDAVAILRHIVFLDEIDTFDLVDNTTGNRVTNLDPDAALGQWSIVANGDVNSSGSFNDAYTVAVDIV
jgi:VCBS repeat-containing protein